MKILEVLFDTDVVHEYDEFHTYHRVQDFPHDLVIRDVSTDIVASYNWNDVIYVRYADKSEA